MQSPTSDVLSATPSEQHNAVMRVLVVGATGFIGSAVAARIGDAGYRVIGVAHAGSSSPRLALHEWREADFGSFTEEDWRSLVAGADAVVNCVGVFAGGAGQDVGAVNDEGAVRLFRACAAAGVRRVIHLSALGAEEERTAFARSKLRADRALQELDLDWVILRPSIVWGAAAYGGSGLLRGLAGLPVLPVEAKAGDVQIVQLDDVTESILSSLHADAQTGVILDLVGPERMRFVDAVRAIRAWLGFRPAPTLRVPDWAMRLGYAMGDLAGLLGWRTPIRSQARRELQRGAVGDPVQWTAVTGIAPQGFTDALRRRPASLQDRRYAETYFLKPVVIGVTALFFIGTGVTSVGPGYDIGVALLELGGMPAALAGPSVIAGGLLDIVAGLAIAFRPTARWGLYGAIALSLFYFVAGTILLPELWRDPIGPMLKIWPLIALNMVGLALLRDR